ncbi:sensor histidine kinase [Eisenbergiella sp.]
MKVKLRTLKVDIFLFIILLVGMFLVLGFNNDMAVTTLTKKISESNQQVLHFCVNRISVRLSQIEDYMFAYMVEDSNMSALRFDSENMAARVHVVDDLSKMYVNYGDTSGFFIYMPDTDFLAIKTWNLWETLDTRELRRFIVKECESSEQMLSWKTMNINGTEYLYHIRSYRNQRIGAIISLQVLQTWVDMEALKEFNDILLVNQTGKSVLGRTFEQIPIKGGTDYQYYYDEDGIKYVMISEPLSKTDLIYCGMLLNKNILGNLNQWQFGLIALMLIGGMVVVAGSVFLYYSIISPLNELNQAISGFASGKLDTKIKKNSIHREFENINESFNNMTEQIKKLKIDIYEHKIERQCIQLKYLRLQTNPHFFLNALNVVYSLALSKDINTLKRLVLCLTRYSRYILKTSQSKVTLKEETAYIYNYLEIQRIRFSYHFDYIMDIESGLDEISVPPFIIQTFVENAFKYAVTDTERLFILIRVGKTRYGMLSIQIEDWGKGFSEEIINCIRERRRIIDKNKEEHFGINNILERLDLLYKNNYKAEFSNGACKGAKVKIEIPLETESEF